MFNYKLKKNFILNMKSYIIKYKIKFIFSVISIATSFYITTNLNNSEKSFYMKIPFNYNLK